MADIQTQLPIKITDNTYTVAITNASALKVDSSHVTQPVSGSITATPVGTYTVAGTVTSTPSGTYTVAGTGGCSSVSTTKIISVSAPTSAGTLNGNQTKSSSKSLFKSKN